MLMFLLCLIWISAVKAGCGATTAPAAASVTNRRAGLRPEQTDYG